MSFMLPTTRERAAVTLPIWLHLPGLPVSCSMSASRRFPTPRPGAGHDRSPMEPLHIMAYHGVKTILVNVPGKEWYHDVS